MNEPEALNGLVQGARRIFGDSTTDLGDGLQFIASLHGSGCGRQRLCLVGVAMGQFYHGIGLDFHGREHIARFVALRGRGPRGDVGEFGVDVGEDARQPTAQNIVVEGGLVGQLGRERRALACGLGIFGRRAIARQLRAHYVAVVEGEATTTGPEAEAEVRNYSATYVRQNGGWLLDKMVFQRKIWSW